MNDKLMEVDRTFLSRSSEAYKHQILGFTSTVEEIPVYDADSPDFYRANNMSLSLQLYFPKLRAALDCGRRMMSGIDLSESGNRANFPNTRFSQSTNEDYAPDSDHRDVEGSMSRDAGVNRSGGGGYSFPVNYRLSFITDPSICRDWRYTAAQKIASLTRALDATSAVLQSPLLPEESE